MIGLKLAAAVAVAAAAIAVAVWIHAAGRTAEREATARAGIEKLTTNMETRRAVEDDVRAGGDGRGAAERLRDGWSRGD
jgi:alkylhydroperoxidase family enzyme